MRTDLLKNVSIRISNLNTNHNKKIDLIEFKIVFSKKLFFFVTLHVIMSWLQ